MKDLEIRGAGNVLGGEQSGHIEGVGFDLYLRLVGEAVAVLKGDTDGEASEPTEIRVELPVDAHIPHDWVPSERVRLQAYQRHRRRARRRRRWPRSAPSWSTGSAPLPEPVERLFDVARLRALVRVGRASAEVVAQGAKVRFFPVELPESAHPAPDPALPGHHRQARSPYDPGAETFHGAGRR